MVQNVKTHIIIIQKDDSNTIYKNEFHKRVNINGIIMIEKFLKLERC